jgi:hypothetical protein
MKTLIWCTSTAVALAALVIVAGARSGSASAAVASMQPTATALELTPTEVSVRPPVVENPEVPALEKDEHFDSLRAYVLGAMNAWPHANSAVETVSYDAVASDIARVVSRDSEPPIWDSDVDKTRTAALLVSLAYNEGARFAKYVDDGSCNEWMHQAWFHPKMVSTGVVSQFSGKMLTRAMANKAILPAEAQKMLAFGDCDGGRARSLFQIHADDFSGGLAVLRPEAGEWMNAIDFHGNPDDLLFKVHGEDLTQDRQKAVTTALHMARKSIRAGRGLCGYTGEQGGCPKGEIRLSMADGYSRKHTLQMVQE